MENMIIQIVPKHRAETLKLICFNQLCSSLLYNNTLHTLSW
jgi:hypothetical protein